MATIPCPRGGCKNGRIYHTTRDPVTKKEVTSSTPCSRCGGSGVVTVKEDQ